MAFNVTFNNISVISWQSVLVVKETGENHNAVSSTPCYERDSNSQLYSGEIQLPFDHDGPRFTLGRTPVFCLYFQSKLNSV